MPKILLFLFSIRPILDCLVVSIVLLNSMKIAEASTYIALLIIILHYGYMGVKEFILSQNNKLSN